MTVWRYLVSDGAGPVDGLAFDEAMLWGYGRDATPRAPVALRLYTYRPCALVGRYQSLEDEVNLSYCEANHIETGRRPTGGGAIIMGPGQLGIALAMRAPADQAPREVLRQWADGVIAGLADLGITSRFRSKNDIEVNGRKIAGLGLYRDDRGGMLFHSSVLVDLDVPLMLRALTIPGIKLSDKGVDRVEERITTVSRELGRPLAGADVRETFRAGFARAFGVELEPSTLDEEECERQAELERTRFGNSEWIRQRSPSRGAQGTSLLKTEAGLLRFFVAVQGEVIKSVLVTGDFNAPPSGITRLEAALKWSRAELEQIEAVASSCLDSDDLGVPSSVVAAALWEATSNALDLERTGHPVRAEGSCYAPEVGNE